MERNLHPFAKQVDWDLLTWVVRSCARLCLRSYEKRLREIFSRFFHYEKYLVCGALWLFSITAGTERERMREREREYVCEREPLM